MNLYRIQYVAVDFFVAADSYQHAIEKWEAWCKRTSGYDFLCKEDVIGVEHICFGDRYIA